jgi:hypothetical protein
VAKAEKWISAGCEGVKSIDCQYRWKVQKHYYSPEFKSRKLLQGTTEERIALFDVSRIQGEQLKATIKDSLFCYHCVV